MKRQGLSGRDPRIKRGSWEERRGKTGANGAERWRKGLCAYGPWVTQPSHHLERGPVRHTAKTDGDGQGRVIANLGYSNSINFELSGSDKGWPVRIYGQMYPRRRSIIVPPQLGSPQVPRRSLYSLGRPGGQEDGINVLLWVERVVFSIYGQEGLLLSKKTRSLLLSVYVKARLISKYCQVVE